MLKVIGITNTIEYKGKRAGKPVSQIILADDEGNCRFDLMTSDDVLEADLLKCVTITGEEPLKVSGIEKLIDALLYNDHEVNIITKGGFDITALLSDIRIHEEDKLFFTIEYQIASKENSAINANLESLMPEDVISFTIFEDDDYKNMLEAVKRIKPYYDYYTYPQIFISCSHERERIKTLEQKVINEPLLENAHIQIICS